jgi:hypothetical protein
MLPAFTVTFGWKAVNGGRARRTDCGSGVLGRVENSGVSAVCWAGLLRRAFQRGVCQMITVGGWLLLARFSTTALYFRVFAAIVGDLTA